jgi:hypothetical protein
MNKPLDKNHQNVSLKETLTSKPEPKAQAVDADILDDDIPF